MSFLAVLPPEILTNIFNCLERSDLSKLCVDKMTTIIATNTLFDHQMHNLNNYSRDSLIEKAKLIKRCIKAASAKQKIFKALDVFHERNMLIDEITNLKKLEQENQAMIQKTRKRSNSNPSAFFGCFI